MVKVIAMVSTSSRTATDETAQLLFEVEHAVEKTAAGSPVQCSDTARSAARETDMYRHCAEATVASICELMNTIGLPCFSLVVNRSVWQPGDWKGVSAAFTHKPEAASPQAETRAVSSNTEAAAHSCSRARRAAAARYPRPGAFEVSVYNTAQRTRRVLFSKYTAHRLPLDSVDVWRPLIPFLMLFAGVSGDEVLLQQLAIFSRDHDIVVDLEAKDFAPYSQEHPLLRSIHKSLDDLDESVEGRNPEVISETLDAVPYQLKTPGVVTAEQWMDRLIKLDDRIEEALQKLDIGLITSGIECLTAVMQEAEEVGLRSPSATRGAARLRSRDPPAEDLFQVCDINNDGVITREEFEEHVQAVLEARMEQDANWLLVPQTDGKSPRRASSAQAASTAASRAATRRASSGNLARRRSSTASSQLIRPGQGLAPTAGSINGTDLRSSSDPDAEVPLPADETARQELDGLRALLRSASSGDNPVVDFGACEVDEPAGLKRCLQALLQQVVPAEHISGHICEPSHSSSADPSVDVHMEPLHPSTEFLLLAAGRQKLLDPAQPASGDLIPIDATGGDRNAESIQPVSDRQTLVDPEQPAAEGLNLIGAVGGDACAESVQPVLDRQNLLDPAQPLREEFREISPSSI